MLLFTLFGILNVLWQMSLSYNLLHILIMLKFVLQCFSIVDSCLLSLVDDSKLSARFSFPDTYVHIIGSAENILIIHGPAHGEYLLHSFCMVDFLAAAFFDIKNSNRFIVASSYEFSACRRDIYVHYSSDVIFMDHFSLVHLSHVKTVAITIVASCDEVDWLSRVPTNSLAFIC